MAVSDGAGDPEKLSKQVGRPYDDLQRPLSFLRLLKLIDNNNSVHDPIASLRVHHTSAEPALHFYYEHLKSALNKRNPREIATVAYASLRESLGSESFIALCREWIWAAVITKQLDMLPQRVGAYWDDRAQTPEFPIAAAAPRQKKLLVGEAFWENNRLTRGVLEKIKRNSQQPPQVQREDWVVERVIFGRQLFTAAIQGAAEVADVRLVTLAEIEPLLLAARDVLRRERDDPGSKEIAF